MPTQGSCRPLVEISVSFPSRSMVGIGVRIDEVGLNATRTTTRWPLEMPPRTPPAWLDRKVGPARICVGIVLAAQARRRKSVADLDPLAALIDIIAAASSASSFA